MIKRIVFLVIGCIMAVSIIKILNITNNVIAFMIGIASGVISQITALTTD